MILAYKIANASIPKQQELEALLASFLLEIRKLDTGIRHINIVVHCGREQVEVLQIANEIHYKETMLEIEISHLVTYVI